jgi:hypothetical protein
MPRVLIVKAREESSSSDSDDESPQVYSFLSERAAYKKNNTASNIGSNNISSIAESSFPKVSAIDTTGSSLGKREREGYELGIPNILNDGSKNIEIACLDFGHEVPEEEAASEELLEVDPIWMEMYQALKDYGKANGEYNVPFHYEVSFPDGRKEFLGVWLSEQRKRKKNNTLSTTEEKLLQSLVDEGKLSWTFTVRLNPILEAMNEEDRWELMYAALLKYGNENGHCNVPHHMGFLLEDKNGAFGPNCIVRLGFWVGSQRKNKKAGKMKSHHEAKLQRLVDEGKFKWRMKDD